MKKLSSLLVNVSLLILMMSVVDLWLAPNYWVKSAIKFILFIIIPLVLNRNFKWIQFEAILVFQKKSRKNIIIGSLLIYSFIILFYILIGPLFNLSGVTVALEDGMAVNRDNFIFVALYIPIVNAFIEEFFFRGFLFFGLNKYIKRSFAYLISASLFSIYHVAIMANWFSIPLFLLLVFSLFIAGLLFNWINEKTGSIYASYFIHAASNLAINTIGLHLFELLPF